MPGIFEVERNSANPLEDKVKWCFAMPGKPRPENFDVAVGSDHKLVILRRHSGESADAIDTLRAAKAIVALDSELERVKSVELTNIQDHDSVLKAVRYLGRVNSLTLDTISAEEFRQLRSYRPLEKLKIRSEVSPQTIADVASTLPHLFELDFKCSQFTREFGEAVANAKVLRTVTLRGVEKDVSGLGELDSLIIIKLIFRDCVLDQSALSLIANMKHLEEVDFGGCLKSSDSLGPLEENSSLRIIR